MGSVVGEKITFDRERDRGAKIPVVIVSASRNLPARGILSLMQMAKTSAALALAEAGIPYISVLTNPTMAGDGQFCLPGDVILAEPKALIGFAGRRVIKETTRADLRKVFNLPSSCLSVV